MNSYRQTVNFKVSWNETFAVVEKGLLPLIEKQVDTVSGNAVLNGIPVKVSRL